jgi:hypothetical protein
MKPFRSSVAVGVLLALTCRSAPAERGEGGADAGNFVRSLWLIHSYGSAQAVSPAHDESTKAALAKALGKDGALTRAGVKALMDAKEFARLAGTDSRLDAGEIRRALEADAPSSRGRLLPAVAAHVAELTTSLDRIDERHRAAGEQLADWIGEHYRAGQGLDIVFVCTGNSRRSVLGATMGNIAAAYYGLPEIRCHSGGTAPTAINERSITTLRAIGLEIEATGDEAPVGPAKGANPVYLLRWGLPPGVADEPPLEATEFSKRFDDESNPQTGFAALMVCSEADAECPRVAGAAVRISMPYLDPKIYDGSQYEAAKYAERRDDLGRLMVAALLQVRRRLAEKNAASTE